MTKKEKNKKKHKSQFILIGSLFVLIGLTTLGYNLYSNLKIEEKEIQSIEDFFEEETEEIVQKEIIEKKEVKKESPTYDYIAILEIPKVNLKKGLTKDKYYNNVNRNIEILNGSTMPDKEKGNFILAGHSGSGRVAYFRNLNKLSIGDISYVYYNGIKYTYKVSNIYDIEKNGTARIIRDDDITTLTMITCRHNTKNQIVIISDLINQENY